ncbi:MAG: M23 family metallopeptidase [Candidatus Gracilibacteria bacterium]|nr:M23 family metallopeptidase [Candidatus Gracilibacteria bacterium]
MKKIIIGLLLSASFYQASAGNFIYPFDKVANPKCRFSSWSSLGSECKIDLPRIANADYTKYKTDSTYRKVYSILWGATYNYGWDVGYGSHLGVDIATSAGTPVRSIGDGEVVNAGWLAGWGNTVSIRHRLSSGKDIYSNYSHLNKIIAKKGTIKSGETVGEVGATGNAYGNHLHFQIDVTNQSHPYWYTKCSKGIEIFDLVNNGMCRDYLMANSVDPIVFLENNGQFLDVQSIKDKQEQTKKIEGKNIKTREQILDEEVEDFMKSHSFTLSTGVSGDNLQVGLNYLAKLRTFSYGNTFSGNLPENGLSFEYDRSALKIFPEKILTLDAGARDIRITGLKSGKFNINIKLGKKVIGIVTVNLYKKYEFSDPTDAIITSKSKISLLDEKLGGVVFKTKLGSKQMYIPYNGTYRLKSLSGKVKFCNISNRENKKCNNYELVDELIFRYEDTYNGALIFNMVPFDYMPIKLAVMKDGAMKPIATTGYNITITNPIAFDKTYLYFNENVEALKKGFIKLYNGYLLQERDISGKQVKEILNNYLSYEYLRSGDNLTKKGDIITRLKQMNKNFSSIDDNKTISRGEFIKIFFDNLGISIVKNSNKVFLDETGNYKDYITTIREKFNFSWKDQFGIRYFQPDKSITIGEALYLANKIHTGFGLQFAYNKQK